MKHVYRILVLIAVFAASIIFMSRNIKEVEFHFDTTVEMGDASFPLVELKTGDYTVNLLHGYGSSMDSNRIRESVTPLDQEQSFTVMIAENETNVRKLKYEIRTVNRNELVDSGSISALDEKDGVKSAKITIQAALKQSTEYAVKITLVNLEGRKIHYYTRLKYYGEPCYLADKMDFIMGFHNQVMDKEKAKNLTKYLEPDNTADNTSLAYVDIHSDFETLSWGKLKPKVITDIVPTIKEFNIETASVELSYFVSADAGSSREEVYRVKEYYRVRYTTDRMYLLGYRRTMEAMFDIDLFSLAKSELKIGISGQEDLDIVSAGENSKICFVRQGALWTYNLAENRAVKVFSFIKDENNTDYLREAYDQHDIRILNMTDEGNIDFLVYGYMNRGDYEGKVGIVLYKYYAGERRIEEQVYIPLETTYQMLKEDLNEFSYYNEKGVFFFAYDNVIYSYNIIARRLEVIASGITNENFIMLKEDKYIAWQDSNNPARARNITVLDLETEAKKTITASSSDNIRILGSIDKNIIFGYARTGDITETADGTTVVPCYKVQIMDKAGTILKTYQVKNTYVTDVEVKDNIVALLRAVKKESGGEVYFEEIKQDNIINNLTEAAEPVGISYRVTDQAMTELYISLPAGFEIKKKPKVAGTVNTILTEDATLRLNMEDQKEERYYVDALGSIQSVYTNGAKAIVEADRLMGVVIDRNSRVIWERGNRYNRKSIDNLKMISTGNGVNSIGACAGMVLGYNQVEVSAKALSASKASIYQLLKKHLNKTPVNLTGCTLDEMLYFVSSGRPVIGMKNRTQAVVIKGYDEYYVTIMDPAAGTESRMALSNASEMFSDAGSVFISYLE